MNKKYMEPEMEISAFEVEDVITTSGEVVASAWKREFPIAWTINGLDNE